MLLNDSSSSVKDNLDFIQKLENFSMTWSNLKQFFYSFLLEKVIIEPSTLPFSAMYMDGQVIARKARGLLHQFRQLREIPCTLAGLCTRCGPGIWDSSHSPRIFCLGHEQAGMCIN